MSMGLDMDVRGPDGSPLTSIGAERAIVSATLEHWSQVQSLVTDLPIEEAIVCGRSRAVLRAVRGLEARGEEVDVIEVAREIERTCVEGMLGPDGVLWLGERAAAMHDTDPRAVVPLVRGWVALVTTLAGRRREMIDAEESEIDEFALRDPEPPHGVGGKSAILDDDSETETPQGFDSLGSKDVGPEVSEEVPGDSDIPPPSDADAPPDEISARRKRRQQPRSDAGSAGYGERGGYRLTEIGNARRFADMHGDRWRFDHDRGIWLEWSGTHWQPDTNGAARRAARGVVAAIYADVAALSMRASGAVNGGEALSGVPLEAMQKWARASSKRSAIEAMLALAASEPEIAAASKLFDADPWLFNVRNGTIDLREGEIRPHRQGDMLTMLSPADYDPHAIAPQWERFLERVLPDPEVRAWVQRYLGYALTGDVREQCLAFFVGAGANGKSVLLDVVLAIVGDYGLRAAPDLVLASHNERHPTELADLDGKRIAVCSEIEQGRQWAESTIKRITGDTTISARRMRQDFYTFAATHKIIVAANTRPVVRGTDDGIWRRMRLVPWDVRIPDHEQDRELAQRLIATEASGILAWLVRGCMAWQARGLEMPAAIAVATEQYRADQDLLGRWIEDRCELRAELWQATRSLYQSYSTWCQDEGLEPWTQPTWRARMLERRGIGAARRDHGRVRVLTGIATRSVP